jgi:hypothetical protein
MRKQGILRQFRCGDGTSDRGPAPDSAVAQDKKKGVVTGIIEIKEGKDEKFGSGSV